MRNKLFPCPSCNTIYEVKAEIVTDPECFIIGYKIVCGICQLESKAFEDIDVALIYWAGMDGTE